MTVVRMDLTDDERYAAVFALVAEVQSIGENVEKAAMDFMNAQVGEWQFSAAEVASNGRLLAQVIPALRSLVEVAEDA